MKRRIFKIIEFIYILGMGNDQSIPTPEKQPCGSLLDPQNSSNLNMHKSNIAEPIESDKNLANLPPKICINAKKPTIEDLHKDSHTVFGSEHTWNDIPEKALSASSSTNNFRMKKTPNKKNKKFDGVADVYTRKFKRVIY